MGRFDDVVGSPDEALFRLVNGSEVFSVAPERPQIVLIGHDDNQIWLNENENENEEKLWFVICNFEEC